MWWGVTTVHCNYNVCHTGYDIPMAARTVVITGAASGIGRAIRAALRGGGQHVRVADVQRSVGGQEPTEELIAREGGSAVFVECDVAAVADVEALVSFVTERYGRLDVIVNNAGIAGKFARICWRRLTRTGTPSWA